VQALPLQLQLAATAVITRLALERVLVLVVARVALVLWAAAVAAALLRGQAPVTQVEPVVTVLIIPKQVTARLLVRAAAAALVLA